MAGLVFGRRGTAVLEFAGLLPVMVITCLGLADLGILLERKVKMVHIAREAASHFSRGADYNQTFNAIASADGPLDLDGALGKIILTEVELNNDGDPVIIRQEERGNLGVSSAIGTLPPGWPSSPATIPNGQELPADMTLYVVELFSGQGLLVGQAWADQDLVILRSIAAF
jgi:hypothetical protein